MRSEYGIISQKMGITFWEQPEAVLCYVKQ